MKTVAKACCILRYLIADACGYEGTIMFRKALEYVRTNSDRINLEHLFMTEFMYEQGLFWDNIIDSIDNSEECRRLIAAISEHIWEVSETEEIKTSH